LDSMMMTPEAVTETLRKYLEFAEADALKSNRDAFRYAAEDFRGAGVVHVGPTTTYLKEGLTVAEVRRVLGQPAEIFKSTANGRETTIYKYDRGNGRLLEAEFFNDVLIGSRTESLRTDAVGTALGGRN